MAFQVTIAATHPAQGAHATINLIPCRLKPQARALHWTSQVCTCVCACTFQMYMQYVTFMFACVRMQGAHERLHRAHRVAAQPFKQVAQALHFGCQGFGRRGACAAMLLSTGLHTPAEAGKGPINH